MIVHLHRLPQPLARFKFLMFSWLILNHSRTNAMKTFIALWLVKPIGLNEDGIIIIRWALLGKPIGIGQATAKCLLVLWQQ